MYRIVFSNDAKKDLKELSKKAPQVVKKLSKLLEEIQEHPRTGTGQVEPLKGYDWQASHHCCDVGPLSERDSKFNADYQFLK